MTVLVGYTRTAEGRAALQQGRESAVLLDAPLALFPLFDIDAATAWPTPEILEEAGSRAQFLSRVPGSNHAAEEMLDLGAQIGARLIVIGVRSRSRVGKILLGSDAQSIILGSPIPVLSVKAENHEH